MRLLHLTLQDFRRFSTLDLRVPSEGMRLVGPNGSGKSSVLEAIAYLGLGKSVRGAPDRLLGRHGAPGFRIQSRVRRSSSDHSIEVVSDSRGKRVRWDGAPVSRSSELLARFPVVYVDYRLIDLIQGSPEVRRRFLDSALCQTDPAYLRALTRYRQVLRNRNRLLTHAPVAGSRKLELDAWDHEFARLAAAISRTRIQFLERLLPLARENLERIAGADRQMRLSYRSTLPPDPSQAMIKVARNRNRDIAMGHTSAGPHREDFHIEIGGSPARHVASAGEARAAILAITAARARLAAHDLTDEPIILLDDPFSDLDPLQSSGLGRALGRTHQIILTDHSGVTDRPGFDHLPPILLPRGTDGTE